MKETSEKEPYVPLSERLNQDVWHDNFVPKYSAIANAAPTRLFICGVWLIFAPMAVSTVFFVISCLANEQGTFTAIVKCILPGLLCLLSISILLTQTRRFINASGVDE